MYLRPAGHTIWCALPEYFRLYAQDPAFTSQNEIGLFSPPPINSIAKAIPDHDRPAPQWFPWNRDLGYHDAMDHVLKESDKIIRADLGEPACLTEYLWMGDLYSNLAYRAIYEAANKVRPRNAGTHIWKINAAWPSVTQQVFDWYLRPNGGYYGMRSACRPLHVQHSVDDQTVQVVSTLAEARPNLKVRTTLVDTAGRVEAHAGAYHHGGGRRHDARRSVARGGQRRPAALPRARFAGGRRPRAGPRRHVGPGGLPLSRAYEAAAGHDRRGVTERSQQDDETIYKVSVRNASRVPAVQVWLEVIRGELGDEVLPAFWSDNALTLLPGQKRELTVRFRTNLLAAASPHLMVEGWNVTPREWTVSDGKPVSLAMAVTGCEVRREGSHTKVQFTATQRRSGRAAMDHLAGACQS